MRRATAVVLLLLLATAGAVPAQELRSPGKLAFAGLSETRFHPLAGTFRCIVYGARLSQDPDSVGIYINDTPLDSASVHPSDSGIRVDYRFRPGLNEVLIEAVDRNGLRLRADALVWAGASSLAVHVADSDSQPVDGAKVKVTLNEQSAVRFDGITQAGNLFVPNLPPEPVTVEVRHDRHGAHEVVEPAAGYVSLTIP